MSQGRWLLYKMQSPSLALAGDEIICRKLHCKHEKVMVKTMVHFSQSSDSGGLGDLESVSNVEVDIKSSRLVQPESFNPTAVQAHFVEHHTRVNQLEVYRSSVGFHCPGMF